MQEKIDGQFTAAMGIVLVSAFLVGAPRFFAPGHALSLWGSWEALVHIWVGFLIGVVLLALYEGIRRAAWSSLLVVTVIELVMFARFLQGAP